MALTLCLCCVVLSRPVVGQADRQAVNSVVQGSASDVLKLAMIFLQALFRTGEPAPPADVLPCDQWHRLRHATIVLQIHDELIVQCPDDADTCIAVGRVMRWCMQEVAPRRLMQFAAGQAPASGGGSGGAGPLPVPPRWHWMGMSGEEYTATVAPLRVPLTVTVSVGPDWGSLTPLSL